MTPARATDGDKRGSDPVRCLLPSWPRGLVGGPAPAAVPKTFRAAGNRGGGMRCPATGTGRGCLFHRDGHVPVLRCRRLDAAGTIPRRPLRPSPHRASPAPPERLRGAGRPRDRYAGRLAVRRLPAGEGRRVRSRSRATGAGGALLAGRGRAQGPDRPAYRRGDSNRRQIPRRRGAPRRPRLLGGTRRPGADDAVDDGRAGGRAARRSRLPHAR